MSLFLLPSCAHTFSVPAFQALVLGPFQAWFLCLLIKSLGPNSLTDFQALSLPVPDPRPLPTLQPTQPSGSIDPVMLLPCAWPSGGSQLTQSPGSPPLQPLGPTMLLLTPGDLWLRAAAPQAPCPPSHGVSPSSSLQRTPHPSILTCCSFLKAAGARVALGSPSPSLWLSARVCWRFRDLQRLG